MFRWLQSRILLGILLILAGVVFLLENLDIVDLSEYIWALLFGIGGLAFLSVYLANRENWWAVIPGMTLLGIGAMMALEGIAPGLADNLGGAFVLGGIGLAFLIVFLTNRENWWAVIPAGVMFTLVLIISLETFLEGFETGGILFLGLAATFALVAILPTPEGPMSWAWIPAGILGVLGFLVLIAAGGLFQYLGPLALILGGGYLLIRTLRPQARN